MPHPLDAQESAQKLSVLRTVSLGMMAVIVVVSVGFALVVFYALDGVPLAGNRFTVGGVSVLAVAGVAATPVVLLAAFLAGRAKRAALVRRMNLDHPEVVGPEADAERLLNAFAGGQFTESAVAFGSALFLAILFHVISSPLLLACIAAIVLFLAARFPFARRVQGWFDAELTALQARRRASGTPPR